MPSTQARSDVTEERKTALSRSRGALLRVWSAPAPPRSSHCTGEIAAHSTSAPSPAVANGGSRVGGRLATPKRPLGRSPPSRRRSAITTAAPCPRPGQSAAGPARFFRRPRLSSLRRGALVPRSLGPGRRGSPDPLAPAAGHSAAAAGSAWLRSYRSRAASNSSRCSRTHCLKASTGSAVERPGSVSAYSSCGRLVGKILRLTDAVALAAAQRAGQHLLRAARGVALDVVEAAWPPREEPSRPACAISRRCGRGCGLRRVTAGAGFPCTL